VNGSQSKFLERTWPMSQIRPKHQTKTRRKAQIWEQHGKLEIQPTNKNQNFCSIKTEQDSHTTTEVTALPPSFDWKQKSSSWHTNLNLGNAYENCRSGKEPPSLYGLIYRPKQKIKRLKCHKGLVHRKW
jgi:hypothetical protein